MSWNCTRCGQRIITQTMHNSHGPGQCAQYEELKKAINVGLDHVIPSSLNLLKKNGLPIVTLHIQSQRRPGEMSNYEDATSECYLTEKALAIICNAFKGRCLSYLVKEYAVNPEFKNAITGAMKLGIKDGIELCQQVWMHEDMQVDKGAIRKAVIQLVIDTSCTNINLLRDDRRIQNSSLFHNMYAVSAGDIMKITSSLDTLKKSVLGVCKRPDKKEPGEGL